MRQLSRRLWDQPLKVSSLEFRVNVELDGTQFPRVLLSARSIFRLCFKVNLDVWRKL